MYPVLVPTAKDLKLKRKPSKTDKCLFSSAVAMNCWQTMSVFGVVFLICLRAVLIKIHKQEVRLFVPGFSCEVHEARKTVGHTRIKVIRPESVDDCNFLIQENDVYVAICFVFTTCNDEFYWISTSSVFLIGWEVFRVVNARKLKH